MRSRQFIIVNRQDLPHANFDGGVWHCDGRLVTRETAQDAYEKVKFWLAIAEAEASMTNPFRSQA